MSEIDGALDRGELDLAIAGARDFAAERGRPIPLDVALRFLPVVVVRDLEAYDGWALRWLARWTSESPGATIERAAEVAASLADLPMEPLAALELIKRA